MKTDERKSSLKVVHKHGPCFQLNRDNKAKSTISDAEILRLDQSRVDSIHSSLTSKKQSGSLDDINETNASVIIPAKDGSVVGSGNYIVTVGLGTPKKDLSLIFDTGSDLTWTQCQPCAGSCYKQKETIFDPKLSKTYTNISCSSPLCGLLKSGTGNSPQCDSSTCIYGIGYGDNSESVGFFGKETLTLPPTDVFPNFLFGCGQYNKGLFGGAAGLIGLGRDALSLVSQTSGKYNKIFSYCLPSSSSSTGHLTLGNGGGGISNSVKFTPLSTMSQRPSLYGLDVTGISVGGQKLSIPASVFSSSGTIIDSGTVITRLPPTAYSSLKSAFQQQMSQYPPAPPLSILDTCYDFSKYENITFPTISFSFNGNTDVELDEKGIFYAGEPTQVCLAFAPNGDDSDVAIFGNVQQKTMEVVYDVAGGKVGFAPGERLAKTTTKSDTVMNMYLSIWVSFLCCESCDVSDEKKSALKVVHNHGPCFQPNRDNKANSPVSHEETLRLDQSRVDSIQSRLRSKKQSGSRGGHIKETDAANIPAKDGGVVGSGNYIVTVGLGTPKKDLSLIFDTGSDLTWTQCEPCVGSCYQQQETIFDPKVSKSYINISCSSALCSSLVGHFAGNTPRCSSTTCVYGIQYGDSSFSVGYFGRETLTLTPTDIIPNFLFGCGQNNQGLFRGAAGLIGLGRDPISLVSQTAQKYKKIFSYCLPSSSSATGHLTLGNGGGFSKSVKFTPLSTVSGGASFYGLDVTGISVGGKKLPISASIFSTSGTIIDSGTVITRLPPTAYSSLKSSFRQLMSKYPTAPALSILDTCYDFSKYTTISVPVISFTFNGGTEVSIEKGIFYVNKVTQVCLAFAPNGDDSDVAIFGNVQQKTLEVVYDVAGGRVGFAPGVVHNHGQCFQLNRDNKEKSSTSHVEILGLDQARVDSIQSRLSSKKQPASSGGRGDIKETDAAKIPVKHGSTVGSGNYIVTVGLGKPKKDLSLIFDTGSGLTWTQCQPCVRSCYQQKETIFDPKISKTYTNISCSSPLCNSLQSATGNSPRCASSSSTCVYGIKYRESSFSYGYFGRETLTLTPTDVFPNFIFGCGKRNHGLFGGAGGMIGLARDSISLVSQTAQKYKKNILLLPPIVFQHHRSPHTRQRWRRLEICLDVTGISVGGKKLPISASIFSMSGTIIDSGTVITRLPLTVYSLLNSTFRQQMMQYPTAPALTILDTCYNFSKYNTIKVPKISFTFNGGTEVNIDAKGIFYVNKVTQVCLAFAPNGDDSDVAIFGNVQQKTLEVMYDIAGGRVGFAPGGCS
ncbi:hypothetical protein Ddye_005231 [Dipteronia dyeriana]|uniref:Peptidase A1 domain-containing protein n=1 Tax=Dipteronia dyeriana TaxID=168575 RepID=A0AAD9XG25_9ROSI|nr:hypothetical protein Ddye_005231 [Dipteronia dyeriana]